jgi:hypothetical protein
MSGDFMSILPGSYFYHYFQLEMSYEHGSFLEGYGVMDNLNSGLF